MNKYFIKIFFITASLGVFLFLVIFSAEAKNLTDASDTIALSWVGTSTNHTFRFKTTNAIPPSGKIVITPEVGAFDIPADFDYLAVDVATSSSINGVYGDRSVAALASVSSDGVTVNSGMSGDITIILNSSMGINAGEYIRMELGSHASFGGTSTAEIINPNNLGSYKINIKTLSNADVELDHVNVMIATTEAVTAGSYMLKIRSNGRPTGILVFGTTQTIMSLNTNYQATCRYSTASGTEYNLIPNTFTTTGSTTFHSTMLTGLNNGVSYSYYVRCMDADNVADTDDYLIYFEVQGEGGGGGTGTGGGTGDDEGSGTGDSTVTGTDDGTGAGAGSGSRGGGGGGTGSGGGVGLDIGMGTGNFFPYPPPLGTPGVGLLGWAYPYSEVVFLKDSEEVGRIGANEKGEFGAFLSELSKGVFTFGVWSTDTDGRKSVTYSTTFWIDDGTQTTVSDIIIPPTMAFSSETLDAGDTLHIFGQSSPGNVVEISMYSADIIDPKESDMTKYEAEANPQGRWEYFLDTSEIPERLYKIKSRTMIEDIGYSGYGEIFDFGLGVEVQESGACPNGDLNGDGRVNITDFSILLYHWGSSNECADQNQDTTVNIIDFSIMMFYWTG